MNHHDCDIARDLMPLAIDEVCSEGSQRFLDNHLQECPPCQRMYERMKATPMPVMNPLPAQEDQALHQSLQHLGKRFRALWIALAVLAGAFLLLLVVAGVNQITWNWVTDIPLDQYSTRVQCASPFVSLTMSANFLAQDYVGHSLDILVADESDVNHTGQSNAVILIYTLEYYPRQAKNSAIHLPDYTFTTGLTENELCHDGSHIYLVDGMEGVIPSDGMQLMLLDIGSPVSEIRVRAGNKEATIYTWGDPLNVYPESLCENGLPASRVMLREDYETWLSTGE
ncbi:MAG: zf-HC2 domain-containing protein [Clostridia bacterium]|nr:zf-HC2 domain-containing protein [Clostridia bacterium]